MASLEQTQSIRPTSSLLNSWSTAATCKHFFPADKVGEDVKGGIIIRPQTGYVFEQSADKLRFRSSCLDTSKAPTLITGAWPSLTATQTILVLHVGYMNSELTITPAASAPSYCRTLRFSPGDISGDVVSSNLTGFGMSDGLTYRASPVQNTGIQSHVIAQYNDTSSRMTSDDNTFTAAPTTQQSLGDRVYSVCGATIPFFRYAMARADNYQLQSASHRADTGSLIFQNDRQYGLIDGGVTPQAAVQYPPYFRMHGMWLCGAAVFVFNTIPSNPVLMNGIYEMAKEWVKGNYVITPYW